MNIKKIITLTVTISFILFTFGQSTAQTQGEKNQILNEQQTYEIKKINITFNSSNKKLCGEIYYPENETQQYPGIVFCSPGFLNAYNWMAKAIAEKGYVVLIFDPPGLGASEGYLPNFYIYLEKINVFYRPGFQIEGQIRYYLGHWKKAISDAISYLINESLVKHLVDQNKIGCIGHSSGGNAVTDAAVDDERIKAIVALSDARTLTAMKIHVPLQIQVGEKELFSGRFNLILSRLSYLCANTPKEYIVIEKGTHIGFTSAFNQFCRCPCWQKNISEYYAVAWFDYYLKNDENAYDKITVGVDHLSRIFKSKYDFGNGDITLN